MAEHDDTPADRATASTTLDDSAPGAATAAPGATTAAGHAAPAPTEPPDELAAGTKIGRCEILRPLGEGGMGVVYLAHDPGLDRPVALKLLRPELRAVQVRLLREGQAVARLAHPSIVRVFDIGAEGDDLFVAMEYVEGGTLGPVLERFAAAGRGLAAAHAAGVVHRDFKPDNVLVGMDDRVVVTDFGLARRDADDSAAPRGDRATEVFVTQIGSVIGTPA